MTYSKEEVFGIIAAAISMGVGIVATGIIGSWSTEDYVPAYLVLSLCLVFALPIFTSGVASAIGKNLDKRQSKKDNLKNIH